MHRPSRPVRLITTVAFVLSILALPSIVGAADARLRLRPNDGPAGSSTQARGRHFPPEIPVELAWDDGTSLVTATTDGDGEFEVASEIPLVEPGSYVVTASGGGLTASDEFEVIAAGTPSPDTTPENRSIPALGGEPMDIEPYDCPDGGDRRVDVATIADLEAALAAAAPGDAIHLADGVYTGVFVAEASGTEAEPIVLCGSRAAILDGGDPGNGYGLHVTGDRWVLSGFTVRNALKGIMLDDADFTLIDGVEVNTTGHEAIHLRAGSSDNTVQRSDIHDTGLQRDKFGEGVYLGSAVSNWEQYSGGEPDQSDRNRVLGNRIWNTTSEGIDVKEGTSGGLIEGNVIDGSTLSGADSWVDVKGNGYVIRGNIGTNALQDGFQTHVIDNMGWGRDNVFTANVAEVNGPGYGFYIHQPDESNNVVSCDNRVTDAASGLSNQPCA